MKIFAAPALAFSLAAIAALAINPVPLAAQETAQPASNEAHAQLYDAMRAGIDDDVMMDTMLEALAQQFVAGSPQIAAMEADNPGIFQRLIDNMRPTLMSYSQRVTNAYRPRMIEAIPSVMTDLESRALARFYASDLGLRLTASASRNMAVENVGNAVIADEQVSAEDVDRDLTATGRRAAAALSEADLIQIAAISVATPGFDKLPLLQQRMAPLRAEMENAPLTQEEEAAIIEAARKAVAAYQ